MMRRISAVAACWLAIAAAPAFAGGDGHYQTRDKNSAFYAGGVIGYGWGRHRGDGEKISTRGVMGGGVVGYRASIGGGTIAVEGDVLASGINRTIVETDSFGGLNERFEAEVGTDILASLRVKGSWGTGNFRPYLTGGIAWQRLGVEFDNEVNVNGRIVHQEADSDDEDQYGFTVGAGIDWQKEGSYSVSLGYHYYRFKDDAFGSETDVTTDLHTIRLGGKLHY